MELNILGYRYGGTVVALAVICLSVAIFLIAMDYVGTVGGGFIVAGIVGILCQWHKHSGDP